MSEARWSLPVVSMPRGCFVKAQAMDRPSRPVRSHRAVARAVVGLDEGTAEPGDTGHGREITVYLTRGGDPVAGELPDWNEPPALWGHSDPGLVRARRRGRRVEGPPGEGGAVTRTS